MVSRVDASGESIEVERWLRRDDRGDATCPNGVKNEGRSSEHGRSRRVDRCGEPSRRVEGVDRSIEPSKWGQKRRFDRVATVDRCGSEASSTEWRRSSVDESTRGVSVPEIVFKWEKWYTKQTPVECMVKFRSYSDYIKEEGGRLRDEGSMIQLKGAMNRERRAGKPTRIGVATDHTNAVRGNEIIISVSDFRIGTTVMPASAV